MYGLPPEFDFNVLYERTLDMVSFSKFQVDLSFSDKCLIRVEGSVSINSEKPVLLPASLSLIFPFIGHTVQKAFSESPGTLSLLFEQGDVLHIHDSSERYESYAISLHGKELAII